MEMKEVGASLGTDKNYNIGLSLLRVIMCFAVVCAHCWHAGERNIFVSFWERFIGYAVPTFILMSFLLTHDFFKENDKYKIRNRFCRLIIPQVGWAIIYWVIYKTVDMIFDTGLELGISALFWQIFTGHSPALNETMWFQVDLIILTGLFLLSFVICKRYYMIYLNTYAVLALYIQYSGLNLYFMKCRYEIMYPAGRFFEILPVAILGFSMAEYHVLDKFHSYYLRIRLCLLCILLGFVIVKYDVFSSCPGYGYSGLDKCVIAAFLVCIFYTIPFERLPDRLKSAIVKISKYTMGIYCMHRLIQSILIGMITYLELDIQIYSMAYCVVIYLLCYIICFIAVKCFKGKYIRMLFI